MALKQRNNTINMDSALINIFLDLIPVAFKQSYKHIQMENPNTDFFCKIFAWFVTKYGHSSVDDCKANCNAMALEWHPSQEFKLLDPRLFRGATFANLTTHPIPNNDLVDIRICVIHQTGLSFEEYKAWITHGDNPTRTHTHTHTHNMDFAAFRTFWERAVDIVFFTATLVLQHGYGMNAVEDNASATSLTNAVSNFGAAYPAT